MVTIDDIARRAGVSAATVSYVINNKRTISEDTKQRVYKAIKELNYKPSRIARSLATQNSQIIGVLISDIANPFFSSIVRGIQDVVEAHGYTAIILNSDENEKKAAHYIEVLAQHRVDGFIVSPMLKDSKIFNAMDKNTPLVFINRRCENAEADIIETDNKMGAYNAVKHLISMGHKKIAFICGPTNVSTYEDRLEGYKQCLEENNIKVDDELIHIGGYSYESGYSIIQKIVTGKTKPTAVIVASGWLTRGVFLGLKELKIIIPKDVSLMSFDETEWSSLVSPGLTTLAQRTFEMGQISAKILLKRLNVIREMPKLSGSDTLTTFGESDKYHIKLMPDLIVRESIGKIAASLFKSK